MSQTIQVLPFTSNCTSALQKNQGGIEPRTVRLRKLRLCQLDYGVLLLGVAGACLRAIKRNKAACNCPSSVQVCWGNLNLDKNLDKELGQFFFTCFPLAKPLSKFPRRTWTRNLDNCRLPCYYIPGASLASKPPCTCPASEPRQPAESYGSYGSYPPGRATCPASEHPLPRRVLNPVANAGLLHSILRPTQDCSTQSCGQRRIAPLNPVANAGLLHSILWPTQDCSTQSCAQFAPWPTP